MKTALLLIDIQNDYFPNGKHPLERMTGAAEISSKILDCFRNQNQTVIHVQHVMSQKNAPFFQEGSEGAEIHGLVKPLPEEPIIIKKDVNCFLNTNLKAIIDQQEIQRVVICGAMSHMCINSAARAASDFGYDVIVIHDACATRTLEFNGKLVAAHEVHGAMMAALDSTFANVISHDQWLENVSNK